MAPTKGECNFPVFTSLNRRAVSLSSILPRNHGSYGFQLKNSQPVAVRVTRVDTASDLNNNGNATIIHPTNNPSNMDDDASSGTHKVIRILLQMPPVSLCCSIIMVVFYCTKEHLGVTKEADVYASWQTIVEKGEIGRLFYAPLFHFHTIQIYFNVITMMALGKANERKITAAGYVFLIISLSVLSNVIYINIASLLCSGENEYNVGFNIVMLSLRMIHIFTMDVEANNGQGEPNLLLGFLPVYLPPIISPWQPVLETIFFELAIIGRCLASTVAGVLASLVFPYLMATFPYFFMRPRDPPPPPPRLQPRPRPADALLNNNNIPDTDIDSDYDDRND